MKYSDILEGHVYTVDFEPVRGSEFNGQHLVIVLKKNNDTRTAIVAPLTSSPSNEGQSKKNIGKISTLPVNLKTRDSFVVYNQVRTVNKSRFISLKNDNRDKIQVKVDPGIFKQVVSACVEEIFVGFEANEAIDYHFSKYVELSIKEIVNSAYQIKKLLLLETNDENNEKIESLITEINFLNRHSIFSSTQLEPRDQRNDMNNFITRILSGESLLSIRSS